MTPEPASGSTRLRLLLETHMQALEPQILWPSLHAVVMEQGQAANHLFLVNQGQLAVEVHGANRPLRTIAVVTTGALLGEMALFGEAFHQARVRVLEEPTELVRISRESIHRAMLFDSELAAEMLLISSERCKTSNGWINLLLDGIQACANADPKALEHVCNDLSQGPTSMGDAAQHLRALLASMVSSSVPKA